MSRKVEVAIIGAGTAGLNAMGQVRRSGKSYVLINGGEAGTTCARVGCMPSKAFIQIADDFHRRHVHDRHAIHGGDDLQLDYADALEHVRDLRDIFVDRTLQGSTDNLGDEFIEGYATIESANSLRVNDELIEFDSLILATGSTPVIPAAWQDLSDYLITTDDFFEQETLPESMAIIGLGVIGLELGQALHRFGVDVIGVDAANTVSGISDPRVREEAIKIIGAEMPLWLGAQAELSEENGSLRVTAGAHSKLVDKALLCIGRRPNLDRLGLDKLGVELNDKGLPSFDPHSMQVGDRRIFIAGDLNADRPILHEAGDEGRIAGHNAVADRIDRFKRKTPLAITFSDPNIVTVGASWQELENRDDVAVADMSMGPVGRALIMAKNKGVIRLYAEKSTGKLLGGAMVAVKGESLAHLLAWVIQMDMTVAQVLRLPFYHPVIEEALQAALNNLLSKVDEPYDNPPGLARL